MQQRIRQPIQNNYMTTCHKGGIKIRDTGNNNAVNPFANVTPFINKNDYKPREVSYDKKGYESIDLNIEIIQGKTYSNCLDYKICHSQRKL